MNVKDIINELKKFSERLVQFNEPLEEQKLIEFEKKYSIILPKDYKELMLFSDGFSLSGSELMPLLIKNKSNTAEFIYTELTNELPKGFLPISPDGAGNYYCLILTELNEHSCPVAFWQHDYEYSANDLPEVANKSFLEFIKEVFIDWTLEEYGHNGKRK
jgi:hypothetical protein